VASKAPFHSIVDAAMNPVPLTVKVNPAAPAVALAGVKEDTLGTGLAGVIERVAVLEVPPPGAGLTTVIPAEPEVAMADAGTSAVTRVALTYVVASAVPFQCTADEAKKLLPLTVRVNAGPPAVALLGESAEIVGIGLALLIVNTALPEVPPPGVGFLTVIEADPEEATSEAGTRADNWVALTYVVVSELLFQRTVEVAMKPPPLTVRVNDAAPAVALAGVIDEIEGAGFAAATSMRAGAEAPRVRPPAVEELLTVMLADPTSASVVAGICAVS